MIPKLAYLLLAFLSASLASAQLLAQGLPACAQPCTLLNQAAQACGGTASADQAIWACFCQSGYLTSLYNSPNGICDAFCTDPSQNQQVMTWYQSNCGNDLGASEHADDGSGAQTTAATTSSSSSATPVASTVANAPATTATSAADSQSSNGREQESGSWWDNHWKWIVMVIVLAIALSAIAILATWLKKRHDRKRDLPNTSFNEGITTRSAPYNKSDEAGGGSSGASQPVVAATAFNASTSGRNSPARTREAFMPYGYGYAHSESRIESESEDAIQNVPPPPAIGGGDGAHGSGRSSPLARGATPVGDLEKGAGVGGTPTPTGHSKRKRVLVRERSVEDDERRPGK